MYVRYYSIISYVYVVECGIRARKLCAFSLKMKRKTKKNVCVAKLISTCIINFSLVLCNILSLSLRESFKQIIKNF